MYLVTRISSRHDLFRFRKAVLMKTTSCPLHLIVSSSTGYPTFSKKFQFVG